MKSSDFQSGQQRTMLMVAVIVVLALIGIGLLLVGFIWGNRGQPKDQPSPTATSALPVVQPPVGEAVVPTFTPLPTATPPPPTATPPPTPVPEPMVVAQEGGVNLRSGPGTNFAVVGRLEGGASARVTGRYADWWQVDYGGTPAWVANWVVTDSNAEAVPEVAPPASPIPSTAVPPTAIPATAAPTAVPATAVPDTRGIVSDRFVVGNRQKDGSIKANSQFGNAGDIWFDMQISNTTSETIIVDKWGAIVQETGHFQMSYGGPEAGKPLELEGGKSWQHKDHFYNEEADLDVGTYHIWMRICFQDGYCVNIDGPVPITIG
jgi:hypothetical protein